MGYFLFKTLTTALIIAGVSELSKRFTFLASLLTALPLMSFLIFLWMFIEQKDVQKISTVSREVFFLVIPSLAFFLILPFLLKRGLNFYLAMGLGSMTTFIVYLGYLRILGFFRIKLS